MDGPQVVTVLHSGIFMYDSSRLSIKFSLVFPSFVYFLASTPMVKWSMASVQSSGGVWVENRAEIRFFFFSFKFFKIGQLFSHFCSCAFLSINANLEFIPINFISLKVPPARVSVQGVKSLWGKCMFILADWGSQQQICVILLFLKTFYYNND